MKFKTELPGLEQIIDDGKGESYTLWQGTLVPVAPQPNMNDYEQALLDYNRALSEFPDRSRSVGGRGMNFSKLKNLVDRQADDPGLWLINATASEAYLQQALRDLHAAVESILDQIYQENLDQY